MLKCHNWTSAYFDYIVISLIHLTVRTYTLCSYACMHYAWHLCFLFVFFINIPLVVAVFQKQRLIKAVCLLVKSIRSFVVFFSLSSFLFSVVRERARELCMESIKMHVHGLTIQFTLYWHKQKGT